MHGCQSGRALSNRRRTLVCVALMCKENTILTDGVLFWLRKAHSNLRPVAVPKISCSLFAHEISTAATRSPPSSRPRRQSARSPPGIRRSIPDLLHRPEKRKTPPGWAVRHSDKLPEKTQISMILRQKSSKSAKDSCGFFLISRKSSFFSGATQF